MLSVDNQKVVSFVYTLLDQEGNVLEHYDQPVSYLHGVDGKMYEKVESAMAGKKAGDEVRVELSPAEGFGDYDPDLTYHETVENMPQETCEIGAEVEFEDPLGECVTMVVTRIENGQVMLDGNHPLAGQTVTFVISIVDIREATRDELDRAEVIESLDAPEIN